MLVTLLLIIYTLITSAISGIVLLSLLQKITGIGRSVFSFTHIAVSGLIMLSLATCIIHVFLPVSWQSHVMIWGFNMLVWLSLRKLCNEYVNDLKMEFTSAPWTFWAIALLFLIGVLFNVSAKPGEGDIGDYHLQAIQWIERYKHVPGIGNLRHQLGNYSNWYGVHAFFGLSFTGLKSAYVLNGTLLLMLIPYFSMSLLKREGDVYMRIIKTTIFFFLLLTLYRKYTGSVTTDYPVTVLTLLAFTTFLERKTGDLLHALFLFLLCCTLVTVKQSAMTVMLIAGWIFISSCMKWKETRKSILLMFASGLLIFVPWLYGSVMCSGYLLFPVTGIDLFDVDWKMGEARLKWLDEVNLWWPRVNHEDIDRVRDYTFAQWFPEWMGNQDTFSLGLLVSLSALSLLFIVLLLFRRKQLLAWRWFNLQAWIIVLTIIFALYIWYTHAPAVRYVFGSMVFMVAYLLALSTFYFRKETWFTFSWLKPGLSFAFTGIFLLSTANFIRTYYGPSGTFASAIVFPLSYKQVHVKVMQIGGGTIYIPGDNEQCWDTDLPCSGLPEKGLEMRGSTLADGFRIEKKEL